MRAAAAGRRRSSRDGGNEVTVPDASRSADNVSGRACSPHAAFQPLGTSGSGSVAISSGLAPSLTVPDEGRRTSTELPLQRGTVGETSGYFDLRQRLRFRTLVDLPRAFELDEHRPSAEVRGIRARADVRRAVGCARLRKSTLARATDDCLRVGASISQSPTAIDDDAASARPVKPRDTRSSSSQHMIRQYASSTMRVRGTEWQSPASVANVPSLAPSCS